MLCAAAAVVAALQEGDREIRAPLLQVGCLQVSRQGAPVACSAASATTGNLLVVKGEPRCQLRDVDGAGCSSVLTR